MSENLSEVKFLLKIKFEQGVVKHICNPSYSGYKGRRIMVQGQTG
jgi:hypothetical protein